jgi:amino acid adenylation domain-containing protein/non-ribosomal peptide synthase protein (TIGR01720 family)
MDLQNRIAALSPAQRALLEQQLQRRNQATPKPTPKLTPRSQSDDRPLSLAQERLWFLEQIAPTAAHHIAIAWRFRGELQPALLVASLRAIVARHESLRTGFVMVAGQPQAVVVDSVVLDSAIVPVIDLRAITSAESELQRVAQTLARLPFDLGQPPLLRAVLVQQGDSDWTLLLTLHHLIADGWSRGILLRELAALYRARLAAEEPSLPALPIQYADFAAWQRSWLQGAELAAQVAYWQQQLRDLTPLALPYDRLRPAEPTFRSRTESRLFSVALLTDLKALSRQAGATLFMVLLAAFQGLLHRYSGQTDVAIGVPVANRNWRETEPLIGFFVNTLVLRSDLTGDPTFLALVQQVRSVAAAGFQHQDVPFAKVVEALQPDRSLSYNPLFQVMFQVQNEAYHLQNAANPELEIPGLMLTQDWVDVGTTKFDLTWHLIERQEGLLAVVEYCTDLFDAATIARMLGHFEVWLTAIVRSPETRLSHLPVLTAAERQQLLVDWNPAIAQPSLTLVHDWFAAQAAQTPDQIAIVAGARSLTYRELNARANQVAHWLQHHGIQPDRLVAVCLPRSPALVVTLLGVLKAGGAYVALDPQLPSDRLHFMLSDAGVDRGFCEAATAAKLTTTAVTWVDIERDWSAIAAFPDSNPVSSVTDEHLAYVIYTSGSTGTPKGTLLTHRGLANYLHWAAAHYPVATGQGAPVQSAIGFDATITSLYLPLLVGKSVLLVPEGEEVTGLLDLLQTQPALSLIKLTPAHLNALGQFLPSAPTAAPPRALVIGGEALLEHHLQSWRSQFPQTRLINEYGPTEAVVGCCVYDATATIAASGIVPIGRPIANTALYVLDATLQPVPVGIAGELYISSIGLARGYLNRPDLTAAKFLPNPFAPATAPAWMQMMYQTGDRVRYLPDGNLEYLGRLDQQVKRRGFRIELEEIAAVLSQHPAVQTAVVTLHADRLIAYWVSAIAPAPAAELRPFLQTKLPDYMLPTEFVELPALPLTVNGKVDRRALPLPDRQLPPGDRTPPRTPTEVTLTEIWSAVLGVPVGIHDNFFALGGDSIQSLQIIARANQANLALTPRQLFQHQTIAELAAIVLVAPEQSAAPERTAGITPLTPIQHWFFEQRSPQPHYFNQAVLLEVAPLLNPADLETVWQALWQHHDVLRSSYRQTTSGWEQFHPESPTPPSLQVVDLSSLSAVQQAAAIFHISSQLQASLDLASCLQRCVLFRLSPSGAQPDRLLLILHHLIVDTVSWQILLGDFCTAYEQRQRSQPLQLPPKTTSFQTWADRLIELAQAPTTQQQLENWLTITAATNAPATPPPVPATTLTTTLATTTTHALLHQVPSAYQTRTPEVLLTALALSLLDAKLDAIVLDLEAHGREDVFPDLNLSRTVGWFTTIFPLRLTLPTHQAGAALKAIKEQVRQVPQNGISYGLLRYLNPATRSQFQAQSLLKFNYLGQIESLPPNPFILGLAQEAIGPSQSPLTPRLYPLEITTWIASQQLHLRWSGQHPTRDEALDRLAQTYLTHLQTLIDHCCATDTGGHTPSDFTAARLTQKQLDQVIAKVKSGKRKL